MFHLLGYLNHFFVGEFAIIFLLCLLLYLDVLLSYHCILLFMKDSYKSLFLLSFNLTEVACV